MGASVQAEGCKVVGLARGGVVQGWSGVVGVWAKTNLWVDGFYPNLYWIYGS